MHRTTILRQIAQERIRQDEQWGGARHDGHHSAADWVALITKHAGRALIEPGAPGALHLIRRQMIRVAALAVAAIEQIDRQLGVPGDAVPRAAREGKIIATRTATGELLIIDGHHLLDAWHRMGMTDQQLISAGMIEVHIEGPVAGSIIPTGDIISLAARSAMNPAKPEPNPYDEDTWERCDQGHPVHPDAERCYTCIPIDRAEWRSIEQHMAEQSERAANGEDC